MVSQRRTWPGAGPRQGNAAAGHHLPHALPVHAEVSGDPAHGPGLGKGQAEDLGLDGSCQHGAPPSSVPRCTTCACPLAIASRGVAHVMKAEVRDSTGRSCLIESRVPATHLRDPQRLVGRGVGPLSRLGAESPQENLDLARGHRGRRGPARGPGGLDVVLVVRAGEGAVAAAPAPAVLGVPLPLTGRVAAGPLPRPQPGMGTEQGLAERAPLPTASPRDPGHGSPPGRTVTPPPQDREGNTPVEAREVQ